MFNQPISLGSNTAPGYQYNKAFGKVFNNDLTIIVNPSKFDDQSFYVANMEQIGNLVNATHIYTEAGNQAGADIDIRATDRNYQNIYDKIASSLPFSSTSGATGRIINRYLQIRFFKKNWTTLPTSVATSVRILQSVKSFFTMKR